MPEPSVALVLATSTGGVGAHGRALAAGLVGDGGRVRVCGPAATEALFDFSSTGAVFAPVEIAGTARDLAAGRALRRAVGDSDIVHAHGLRAATVASLAGIGPLVVTWHNAVLEPPGVR